jgi:hypothetical protein
MYHNSYNSQPRLQVTEDVKQNASKQISIRKRSSLNKTGRIQDILFAVRQSSSRSQTGKFVPTSSRVRAERSFIRAYLELAAQR